jgi:hypothetical protein
MAQDSHFDIPHQLREFTERNVAQVRGAYIQFLDAMVQTTNMWLGAMPFNEMTSGTKVIHERVILFAKQNVEACFAFASELANARDLQDVVGIQSRYAQTQMRLMRCRRDPAALLPRTPWRPPSANDNPGYHIPTPPAF